MRREGLLLYGLESGDPISDSPTSSAFPWAMRWRTAMC